MTEQLDLAAITQKLSEVAVDLITGKTFPMKQFTVTVSIPAYLEDIAKIIAGPAGKTVDEVLAQMATQGITNYMSSIQQQQQGMKVQPSAPSTGLPNLPGVDMSGIMAQLGKIKDLGSQLENIEKALNNGVIPSVEGPPR